MPAESDPNAPSNWTAVAGVCLGVLMFTLDASIVNIAIPTFLKVFQCGLMEVQWVITGYLLVIVCLLLPIAALARRIGQKRIFLFGLVLFTIGSFLCGLAPGIEWLIAFRLVQGAGAVCMAALMSSMVMTACPKNRLGQALGIVAAAATLGTSLGPTIGGFLVSWKGWQAIFLVNLPFGIVASILIARSLPRDTPPKFQPTKETLRDRLAIFRNTTLCSGLLGRFIVMAGNATYLFLTPLLLEDALKYSTASAGLLLAVAPVVSGISSPIFGALSDKFGSSRFSIAGLGIMLLSLFTMSTFTVPMTEWDFVAKVVLWGLGLGLFNAPNNTRTMQSVPASKSGAISAFFSLAIMLGQMVGVVLAGAWFHHYAFQSAQINPSTSIHLLPPNVIASSVGQSILLISIPLAALLIMDIRQAFKERKQPALVSS